MSECYGKNFILNGELQPAAMFDNSLIYEGDSIYEVIRLVRGNPLFFTDHMERLAASTRLKDRKPLADIQSISKSINTLVRSDKKKEINIKIVFNYNNGSENYLIYYIESIYPTNQQYKNGVRGILVSAERQDPVSKVINHKLRSAVYHQLINEKGYEALLVNDDNQITEGSRSNIFFLKDETLITAPDNVVLNGITRKHILDICQENFIKVKFDCVRVSDIHRYDAVFMTGTSPTVLPFCCINEVVLNVNFPLIDRLRRLYMIQAEQSVRLFRPEY